MLLIQNVTLFTPEALAGERDVLIRAGRIAAVARRITELPASITRFDGRGLLLTPGWLDLQINGGFGKDFTAEPDSLWTVAARLPRYGVTSFLPTLITSPAEKTSQALAVWAQGPPPGLRAATPLGWHLEGPFLNPQYKGAHNPADLRLPTLKDVEKWRPENGVRLVTLAPELPGAPQVMRALRANGVVVGAGHSAATLEQAQAALETGITYGTHLFNAMTAWHHRRPGLAGALLADARATVSLIVDGLHVHPGTVRLAWQIKGPERFVLVSDAMAALGMQPGEYRLGDLSVQVTETAARLADGTLAGSILPLDAAVRNLMAFTGASLADVLPAVTRNPARLLGCADRGEIAPGKIADLVLLTPDVQIAATWVGGQLVYDNFFNEGRSF